ncbi:MAG TPA: OmpA family protein, partial [Pyrinomonadaceae bacterium]|nr:OmpA family protein [Pyrinomonadaceae bacterium]
MKTTKLGGTFAVILAALSLTSANLAKAQTSDEVKRQQAALERQRVELENKSAEVQQKMRELEAAQQQLQTQQSGRSLSMNLSGDVLFDYDKATLKPAAEEALKKVAVVLSQFPESKVTVEGCTDAKGSKSVNSQLS